jgi:hypothetical protein
MFISRNFFGPTVSYLLIHKLQNTMKFKRRHGKLEQGCVQSESHTATDALPPILPACRQPLLPACVFIAWDTVCHPRCFLFRKFVHEPICSWWEAFMNRASTVHRGERKKRKEKKTTVPVPLCPPQILNRLAWHCSQTSAARGQWLTVWAIAQPPT